MGRDHEHVVLQAVGGAFVRHARPSDARDADEGLDEVVETRRRQVVDRARAHHELALARPRVLHPEVAVVLNACEVEVREVPAVVDDPLCVGVGEADAVERRVLERRLAIGEAAELQAHEPMLLRAFMTSARRLGVEAVDGRAAAAGHRLRGQQRVDDRLLGRLDRRVEERVHRLVRHRLHRCSRGPRRERQGEVAARRLAGAARHARRRASRAPRAARTGAAAAERRWRRRRRSSRRPRQRRAGRKGNAVGVDHPTDRHAVDRQPRPRPVVRLDEHADDVSRPRPRGRPDAPFEAVADHPRAAADVPLGDGTVPAASSAARACSGRTRKPLTSLSTPSQVSATTGRLHVLRSPVRAAATRPRAPRPRSGCS